MDTRAPSTARIEANLPLCVPLQSFAKPVIACHITTHLPETCPGAYCDEHSGPILELYAYSCLATLNAKSLTVSWAKTPTCFTPSSRCCVFGLKPSYFSNRNLPLGYLREPMSSPKKTMSSPKTCYFKEWTNQSIFSTSSFYWGRQLMGFPTPSGGSSAAHMESTTRDSCPGDSRKQQIYTSDC